MKTGFESIPTGRLANETLQRAEDVYEVNDAAWMACLWAFVGLGVAASIGMPLDVFYGWSTGWAMSLAFVVGAWPLWKWVVALWGCDRFAREMKRRRRELITRKKCTK